MPGTTVPDPPPTVDELRRAVDPDALLAGEDPGSGAVTDAVHWVTVYGELVSLKGALLQRAEQVLQGVSDDAMKEADIDQRLLGAQLDRCRRRLDFWTQRSTLLAAAPGDAARDHGRGGGG